MSIASCSMQDDLKNTYETDSRAVIVDASINVATKANTESAGDSFLSGDKFSVENLTTTANTDSKAIAGYVYENSQWVLEGQEYLIWEDGENEFQAWSPVTATYSSFDLSADQSSVEKLRASDWMTATATSLQTDDNKLSLSFDHKLSKVLINVTKYQYPFEGSESVTGAEFNIAGEKYLDGLNVPEKVSAYITSTSAMALLAPGKYTSGEVFLTISMDGQQVNVLVPENGITLESGNSYVFSLTVGNGIIPDKSAFITSVLILPWNEVRLDVGCAYPEQEEEEGENPEEPVGESIYGGTGLLESIEITNLVLATEEDLGEFVYNIRKGANTKDVYWIPVIGVLDEVDEVKAEVDSRFENFPEKQPHYNYLVSFDDDGLASKSVIFFENYPHAASTTYIVVTVDTNDKVKIVYTYFSGESTVREFVE